MIVIKWIGMIFLILAIIDAILITAILLIRNAYEKRQRGQRK